VLYSVTAAKVNTNSGAIWQSLGTCRGDWSFMGRNMLFINNC